MVDRRYAAVVALLSGLLAGAAPMTFNDLNHNGRMDPYEDPGLSEDKRVDDLIGRMTIEEKAGAMMHGTLPAIGGVAGMSNQGYDLAGVEALVKTGGLNSFITRLSMPPAVLAAQNNAVQQVARGSRLGIPVTISTDPRNHFQAVLGASTSGNGFSQWPETLGFAAIGDAGLVRRFGDIARREYRAVGIHMALSPQADLASEPRWSRGTATFGSDPRLVSRLAGAYVQGFQHGDHGLARDGVAAVVKHWVGYGAEPDGFDAHNYYGRNARLDDASFARHVAAFDGALAAGAAGVMPTYPIINGVALNGRPLEPVAAGYNRQLITGLLRGEKRYRGMVLSDWGITNDCDAACQSPTAARPQMPQDIAMPWGVMALTRDQRFAKAANAGLDQFGGVDDPAPLIAGVRQGMVSERVLDGAVRRIMLLKFRMGLFDNPFVDPASAARIAGDPASQRLADEAQRRAMVLLENRRGIPVAAGRRVWLSGIDPAVARRAGLVPVASLKAADVAIVRTGTPSEQLHPYHFFGARQHEGRLDFRAGDAGYDAFLLASASVPTILAVDMDRPALISNVRTRAAALLAIFGASDAALIDVVTGNTIPAGRLPFEIPSSMAAVERQDPARIDDSSAPTYKTGAGMTIAGPIERRR